MQCGSVDDFISPILPSSRGFKLANLNITSLVKHIDELRILLADTPVDVLSINETRLDDSRGGSRIPKGGVDGRPYLLRGGRGNANFCTKSGGRRRNVA